MTGSTDLGGSALCRACGWTCEASSSRSVLGLAAQHHQRTGHEVTTRIEREVTFGAAVVVEGEQGALC